MWVCLGDGIPVVGADTRRVCAANPVESIYLNAYFYAYPVALTFIGLSPLLTLIISLICFVFVFSSFYLMLKKYF